MITGKGILYTNARKSEKKCRKTDGIDKISEIRKVPLNRGLFSDKIVLI